MFPLLFLLLFLGIKQVPIDDELIKDFPVNEIVDETTTDCTENPSSGGPMDQSLKIELIEPLKPEDVLKTPSADHRFIPQDSTDIVRPMMVPVKPPQPDPPLHPESPIVLTPEPEMLAILSITGVMLLFFLFGRRAGHRFSRRI